MVQLTRTERWAAKWLPHRICVHYSVFVDFPRTEDATSSLYRSVKAQMSSLKCAYAGWPSDHPTHMHSISFHPLAQCSFTRIHLFGVLTQNHCHCHCGAAVDCFHSWNDILDVTLQHVSQIFLHQPVEFAFACTAHASISRHIYSKQRNSRTCYCIFNLSSAASI